MDNNIISISLVSMSVYCTEVFFLSQNDARPNNIMLMASAHCQSDNGIVMQDLSLVVPIVQVAADNVFFCSTCTTAKACTNIYTGE